MEPKVILARIVHNEKGGEESEAENYLGRMN